MTTPNTCSRLLILFLTWAAVSAAAAAAPRLPEREIRALWVSRWDYASREDIARIMADAADLGLTTVFFQVRGNATVYYPSRFEPWDPALGGGEPDWNPLSTAISAAAKQGLSLHAWINVFPGWRGERPPKQADQLFNAHPDWFMVDRDKNPMALNDHYVWLNPALPAVQRHLRRLVFELAGTPGLAGIHFDYFRYPGPGFSFDDETETAFRRLEQRSPDEAAPAWDRFRRAAISDWLRAAAAEIKGDYPDLILSSAVIGAYDLGPRVFMQDAHQWLTAGSIDYIVPMTYTLDHRLLGRWLDRHGLHRSKSRILPGLMAYPDIQHLIDQIQIVRDHGFQGFSLFAYKSLMGPTSAPARSDSIRPVLSVGDGGSMTPNRASGLTVSEILWTPEHPRSGDSIQVVCRVDGLAPDQEVSLVAVWSDDGRRPSNQLPMRRSPSKADYWYATEKLPPQLAGTALFLRVFAYHGGRIDQAVASDLTRIDVDATQELYRADGTMGPLLTLAVMGAIDESNNVWLVVPGEGIRIITPDGSESAHSPLHWYADGGRLMSAVDKIAGITAAPDSGVGILFKENGRNLYMTARADAPGLKIAAVMPGPGRDIATAGRFLFVLTNESWFVTGRDGEPVGEVELDGYHTVSNIAVTPSGRNVYVACRTEGSVHHWFGYISSGNLNYTRLSDLDTEAMSLGRVTVAGDGTLFLAATAAGQVRVLNPELRVVDLLVGGTPALRAPRLVLATRDRRVLYVLETGGTTPVRMHRWISTKIPTN